MSSFFQVLGQGYGHHIIVAMGLWSLGVHCVTAIHTAWKGGTIDHQGFGVGAAAIIGATGAALGIGTHPTP